VNVVVQPVSTRSTVVTVEVVETRLLTFTLSMAMSSVPPVLNAPFAKVSTRLPETATGVPSVITLWKAYRPAHPLRTDRRACGIVPVAPAK